MHNFGVLAAKDPYFIYRSGELGKRGLAELKEYLSNAALPFPKTIVYMNAEGYAFPMYYAIEEWKAQHEYGFKFYHSFGTPRTYLDGQNPYQPTDEIDKFRYFGFQAKKYFKKGPGGITGGISNLLTILDLILDPENQPVLFHCLGGFHRTGMVAMLIRVLQGMPWKDLIAEYKHFNPIFFREKNVEFVERFSSDIRFLQLWQKHKIPLTILPC